MPYSVKIICDSVAPNDSRLTTFEIEIPKWLQAEVNTHRMCSRNSASSRAIPFAKTLEKVKTDPVTPVYWGKNQKGMQAKEELESGDRYWAEVEWLEARDVAIKQAETLFCRGVHKQIVNRILEPWLFVTVIISATEWSNFFKLRCHADAQPELKYVADMMLDLYVKNEPRRLDMGQWHLPMIQSYEEGLAIANPLRWAKISAARCARVSYLTHAGVRDEEADLALYDRLVASGHWSPAEHPSRAEAAHFREWRGNFYGFTQLRKTYPQSVESGM